MSFVALLAAGLGPAKAAQSVRATIPVPFIVEGKALPAGQYDFIPNTDDRTVQVLAVGKGESANALIVTRLSAEIHTTPKDAHVVFDKTGDIYILSELWIPGIDGYVLHITKGKHEHRTINTPS